ncbi:MAG: DUF4178 domain-containing protein [Phototrophicaceae bacterium]
MSSTRQAPARDALQQLQCPNCGTALTQYSAGTQTLVCPNCGSYVAIGGEELEVNGKTRKLPDPGVPLKIGKMLTLDGVQYFVMGRVVYVGWDDDSRWTWNEWLLGAEDGRMLWLSLDEKGFALFTKHRFREQFDARSSRTLNFKGTELAITERYPARIVGAEGELTWRATADDRLFVAEVANRGEMQYSVQQTEEEIEVYEGKKIDRRALAVALGKDGDGWLLEVEDKQSRGETWQTVAGLCILFAVFALIAGIAIGGLTGRRQTLSLPLTAGGNTIPVDFGQVGRPVVLDMTFTGTLAPSSGVDASLSVIAPNEISTELFTKSFFSTPGGALTNAVGTQLRGTNLYIPNQRGEHTVRVAIGETFQSGDFTVQVIVRRDNWVSGWFIGYAILVGLIGIIAFLRVPTQK